MAESNWIEVPAEAARRHPLFGARGLVLALVGAFAWCAAAAAARLGLLVVELLGLGPELAVDRAVLTYIPIPDAAFAGLFAWLALMALRPGSRSFPESATVVCGLQVLVLVPYAYVFRHWSHGVAFSLAAPATYLHVVAPVALALWAGLYVNLSRRVKITYLARLNVRDPAAPATTAGAETSP